MARQYHYSLNGTFLPQSSAALWVCLRQLLRASSQRIGSLGRLALHPIFQAFMTWVRFSGFLPCVDHVITHEICPFGIQIMVHNSSDF